MKGHIRQRSPGRWAIILDIRDPDTGRRRRKWHSFKGGQAGSAVRMRQADSRAKGWNVPGAV
jgi:hypothetical protein